MENVGQFKSKILLLLSIFLIAVAFSAALPSAEAGTVFARPEPVEKIGTGETYPESRFGHAPAPIEGGINRGYAARMVEEMEASDESDRVPSRRPAGMEFASGGSILSKAAHPEPAQAEPASVAARRGVQEVALIAGDLGYFPKTVFVSRDVPVRMFVTGSSRNTLCIMMDSFQVKKQIRSQKIEEITFTPNVPGKYRFYCPVNGMEGTLIVKELASNLPEEREAATRAPASE